MTVHAPEDLILHKLRFIAMSQQQKRTRNIVAILYAQTGRLDEAYLIDWVERLRLIDVWRCMLSQSQEGDR